MMLANSSGVVKRPGARTVYVNSWPRGAGSPPIWPAGAWRFCSLMALTTSVAERPSWARRSGRTHTRIPYSEPPIRSACATPGTRRMASRRLRTAKLFRKVPSYAPVGE
jgi:hypothetical protein